MFAPILLNCQDPYLCYRPKSHFALSGNRTGVSRELPISCRSPSSRLWETPALSFFSTESSSNRIEGSERYGLLRRPSLDTTTSVSWNALSLPNLHILIEHFSAFGNHKSHRAMI